MKADFLLDEYCQSIAEEILRDAKDEEQAYDWCAEYADGSEYVIYYAKAHELCQNCNTDEGEYFVADCWGGEAMTYNEMACRIAYGEIVSRLRSIVYCHFNR